jgi:mRNA-degrading endonuclease RelE of RelBE toxin-antitoxin system
MNILSAIHRLAEDGSGDIKMLRDSGGEKRLRVGDYRVRFTEEAENTLRIHTVRNRKDAYR